MKKVLLATAAMFLAVGVFAQGQPLGFGLKAGVNFPKYHFSGENSTAELNSTTNFHVTAFMDAPLSSNFSVQPGISLQGKGAKLMEGSFFGNEFDVTQNTMWVEVPVNFVAKLPTANVGHIFIGAGPYVGVGLSGKNKVASGDSSEELGDFKFGKNEDQKGFDFGVNFIGGYQLSSGLQINAGYGLGLLDIAPENNGSVKQTNRVFSAGIGFLF